MLCGRGAEQGGVCSVTADSILIPFRLFTGYLLSVLLMLITADRCQKDLHNRRPNVLGPKVDAEIFRNFLFLFQDLSGLALFGNVTLCGLVKGFRGFKVNFCLHHHGRM